MRKRVARMLRKLVQFRRDTGALLVVFDLEATCWEPEEPDRREIIEIGAVCIDPSEAGHREFRELVRPVRTPQLSAFCATLLPLTQEDVNRADSFSVVFHRFIEWIGKERYYLAAWGSFDRLMWQEESLRCGLPMPSGFVGYINLQKEFGLGRRLPPLGLLDAMSRLGLEGEGVPHRALDDARNLARIARILLDNGNARLSLPPGPIDSGPDTGAGASPGHSALYRTNRQGVDDAHE